MSDTSYFDLTLDAALALAGDDPVVVQRALHQRLSSIATEQETFRRWCERFNELYFTTTMGPWGADLWADDPSATTQGRSHISINSPSVYVDIPASLQAYEPIENMLASEDSPEHRTAAQHMERIRKAWKVEEKWQLKRHKAATVKGLYGRTASYTYYDRERKRMCARVIENPSNLWMGYKSDEHTDLEWAARVELMDPMAVTEMFSVDITAREVQREGGPGIMPWVMSLGDISAVTPHPELTFGPAKIEVWDYWFRRPKGKLGKLGKATQMETWNVVIAGNAVVRGPIKYTEYEGEIPYKPLYNTYIPGTPTGRSELHDMEMLIREKMTRITAGAQMIAGATAGDFWQLIGPDAPSTVPASAKPKRNQVAAPGAGNRIEAIVPFIAQFQLEQFLGRIDREMAALSGLNDLLLGLAPQAVLNSSKAINALVANYEARISMRRLLFYEWDRDTWNLGIRIWGKYDETVQKVIDAGGGVLDIIAPSLSPRDEFETAQRAANLVAAKLWSQARGMDAVGVDDPEQEQNIIREERTDATLWPADVQVMAQLMAALQSLGLTPPPGAAAQVGAQAGTGTEALRQALAGGTGANVEGSQYGTQGVTPPIEGAAPEAGGAPVPFAQPQAGQGPVLQGMLQNGVAKGRIMTNQPLGRR